MLAKVGTTRSRAHPPRGYGRVASVALLVSLSILAATIPASAQSRLGLFTEWQVEPILSFDLAAIEARADDPPLDDDAPPDLQTGVPLGPDLGIEADGRIPSVDLPDDLAHPARWRYIPEGLVPAGNIFDRFLDTTFITPILFFEGDVGTGGGLHFADIDFAASRRQMSGGVTLSYTTEGQQQYRLAWRRWYHQRELPSGGLIQEERSYIGASAGFTRTLTRRFYGRGPKSKERAESTYSESLSDANFEQQLTFPHAGDDFVLNWGATVQRRNLGSGQVTGIPDTRDAFAADFTDGDSIDSLWVGGGVRYDTRDSQHLPYRGSSIGLDTQWSPLQSGDQSGAIISVVGSTIQPVPPLFHTGGSSDEEHPPIDTLALGLRVSDSAGNLPFWALPTLGGNFTLRGYGPDRFVDDAAYHLVAEYRFWFLSRGFEVVPNGRIERLGLALFTEGGNVGESVESLLDEDPHWSAGVGLRMTFERQALFRADVGFSEEGANLAVNFGLSF